MEPEEGKLIEEYRTLFKFCRINGATEEDIKKLKKITSKSLPFNPLYRNTITTLLISRRFTR
jgi:hypothetical protein